MPVLGPRLREVFAAFLHMAQRLFRTGGELDLSPYREACLQGRRRPYESGGFHPFGQGASHNCRLYFELTGLGPDRHNAGRKSLLGHPNRSGPV